MSNPTATHSKTKVLGQVTEMVRSSWVLTNKLLDNRKEDNLKSYDTHNANMKILKDCYDHADTPEERKRWADELAQEVDKQRIHIETENAKDRYIVYKNITVVATIATGAICIYCGVKSPKVFDSIGKKLLA